MSPLQTRDDVARMVGALRHLLVRLESAEPRQTEISQAWDVFRGAFGIGNPPTEVTVDSTGRPDIDGTHRLINMSTALTREQQRLLAEVARLIPRLGDCGAIVQDGPGSSESIESFRMRQRTRPVDTSPMDNACSAVQKAIEGLSGSSAGVPQEIAEPNAQSVDLVWRLVGIYSDGVADNKILRIRQIIVNENLTINEKLKKMDSVIRIPPTASARALGELFSVTKQAVMSTSWWEVTRRGKKVNEIDERHSLHRNRAQQIGGQDPKKS